MIDINSFEHCLLTGEGECSISIQQNPADLKADPQVFIHPLDTRFAVPGETPKPLMTQEEMLNVCNLCVQKGLHNPVGAIRSVCLRQCGQDLGTFDVAGVLINGPTN